MSSCSHKSISLPVLTNPSAKSHAANAWQSNHDKIKHSRIGRWRAAVLILVHVGIAIHILIWYVGGRAVVSPVEPSESMQTIREGVINAGFVFFALAILSTLVLGRWFCGWGCHIVALQDLCSWLMMKLGIKPKPFRSRLLMWFPLLLAIYMFVWPALHRELLRPLFMDARGRLPWWLGQSDPIPGITTEFLVHDFWATFAPWPVAIPFIAICTFGVVYFLGSKGFCTYGCPYGGFFAPADKLAIGKIRVTDACEHCGHCTAVCTSNVRVHEEVRDFGMVVDPGCMKCMDCVSVCPNDALYFGLGTPTILAKPRTDDAKRTRAQARALKAARFDLKGYEEVALFLLFLIFFWSFRGMLNQVPMLMAVGMGLILTFCAWKLWCMRPVRLGGVANIRLQAMQLRYRGKFKPAGWALAFLTLVGILSAAWSGVVKAHRWEADRLYTQLETPLGTALRPDFQPTSREAATARRALALFERSASMREHGIGWSLTPDEELNVAYMQVLLGNVAEAERRMERVIDTGHPTDSLIAQAAELLRALHLPKDREPTPAELAEYNTRLIALHERALKQHPKLDGVRAFLIGQQLQKLRAAAGGGSINAVAGDELRARWSEALAERHPRSSALLAAARLELALGNPSDPAGTLAKARPLIDRAEHAIEPHSVDERLAVANLLAQISGVPGNPPSEAQSDAARAKALIEAAASIGTRTGASALAAAGAMMALREPGSVKDLTQRGLDRSAKAGPHGGRLRSLLTAANLKLQLDDARGALELFREAGALVQKAEVRAGEGGGWSGGTWELHGLGLQLWRIGVSKPDGAYLLEGVKWLEAASAAEPDSGIILHDLAIAYYSADRFADAERAMTLAATKADRNAYLARRLSGMLAERSNIPESLRWERIAKEREAAAGK